MLGLQFTIRGMLLSTAVLALICWTLAGAVRGQPWAVAIILSLIAVAVWAIGQVLLLCLAAIASLVFGATQRKKLQSPFANETPAPQILPTDHHVAD